MPRSRGKPRLPSPRAAVTINIHAALSKIPSIRALELPRRDRLDERGLRWRFFGTRDGVRVSAAQFKSQLKRFYSWYTLGLLLLVGALAIAERMGLPRSWIGSIFLLATIALYAGIGIMSRTADASEYYVAGRRVPAFYNGMATGADWMSAASFIGLAGTLYLTGFNGLAFNMGWAGGYRLVALVLARTCSSLGSTPFLIFWADAMAVNNRA